MNNLSNKKILLIICGGIAAYKSLELIRLLKKKGTFVKAFEEVAYSLEVGEIGGPVETNFGIHLIYLLLSSC